MFFRQHGLLVSNINKLLGGLVLKVQKPTYQQWNAHSPCSGSQVLSGLAAAMAARVTTRAKEIHLTDRAILFRLSQATLLTYAKYPSLTVMKQYPPTTFTF